MQNIFISQCWKKHSPKPNPKHNPKHNPNHSPKHILSPKYNPIHSPKHIPNPKHSPKHKQLMEFNLAKQGDVEREHVGPSDPNRWWNQATEIPVANDDGNDGLDSRDELHSVHSDDEGGDHTWRLEFNPQTKKDDFKFELNMEFGSIEILRTALKENFIHTDREYVLIYNDRDTFRAKCNADWCPWMINAHVQLDGMTFKITTITEGGHQCGIVLENRARNAAKEILEGCLLGVHKSTWVVEPSSFSSSIVQQWLKEGKGRTGGDHCVDNGEKKGVEWCG
ncbi:hypothetical protein G4B88_018201 [Cannabis sativa]|uniref:Transposase MuDR plant domain-containing protein n=1 Tax=Cannabis sativa TaxID=3483 RepID=A0A7J6G971_CANSA|nr:hypothetical protein G4B88_018201 [Cannabis sativa]